MADRLMTLRPREIRAALRAALEQDLRVLVVGAPGMGKTALVYAAARDVAEAHFGGRLHVMGLGRVRPPDLTGEPGLLLVVDRPATGDPTEAAGLPWREDGRAVHLPFERVAAVLAAHEAGWTVAWFDDDLGQASVAVQASRMALLDAVLPAGVRYIAATNRRGDRAGVAGLLEPVMSRFTGGIVEMAADLDEWVADFFLLQPWAQAAVPVLAYLRNVPQAFHEFTPSADLAGQPCPRTWEGACRLVAADPPLSERVRLALTAGLVGEGRAIELRAYIEIMLTLVSVDSILAAPDTAPIPGVGDVTVNGRVIKGLSQLYMLATALPVAATPRNVGRVTRYARRVLKEARQGAFAALILRGILSRQTPEGKPHPVAQALQLTPEWTEARAGWGQEILGL